MERIDPQHVSRLLWVEHCHRYQWAAALARGVVVDAGCGAGYGSSILAEAPAVERCTGIDVAADVVTQAERAYGGAKLTFRQGDLTHLDCPERSADTVVCLEVLEHLEAPQLALAEFARILKPGGLLLASVPALEFDELCEATYGPNPFHKSRFTLETLRAQVAEHFAHAAFVHATIEIASVIRPTSQPNPTLLGVEPDARWPRALGSLLFVASHAPLAADVAAAVERARIRPALALVEHDAEQLTPRMRTIADQARLVEERDAYIRKLEAELDARTALIAERDRRIWEQEQLVAQQQAAIAGRDERLGDFEACVASQTRMIDERDALIRRTEDLANERAARIAELDRELEALRTALNSTTYCLKMTLRSVAGKFAGRR